MCFSLRTAIIVSLTAIFHLTAAQAQEQPIGYWRSHLPYNNAIGVATDGNTLYAISEKSFFSYNAVNGELSAYSKVDGMADIGMSQIGYDLATGTVILAYQNSDLDLYKDHVFYNIPDIRIKNISGAKTINHIYTDKGMAYLSTEFGIVILNLDKRQFKDTYVFTKNSETIGIKAFTADNTYFYAATARGLYRASRNAPNLQSFDTWTALDTLDRFTGLATVQQTVFASGPDSLFRVNGNAVEYLFSTGGTISHIDPGKSVLYLSLFYPAQFKGSVKKVDLNYQIIDSFRFGYPRQATELADGALWVADNYDGLMKHTGGDNRQAYVPLGPYAASAFDIIPYNKEVWIAHGGHRDNYGLTYNTSGISHFRNESWTSYRSDNFAPMQGMYDVIDLNQDPKDGTIYGGSIQEGLVAIRPDGSGERFKQGTLEAKLGEPDVYPATSSAFDQGGNLWVTQLGSLDELAVRTPEGQWYHYNTPYPRPLRNAAAGLLIDDYNQKWYYGPQGGGVIVYNDNSTPADGSDDTYYQFRNGQGAGNLPSTNVYCLAKDRDGAIWVGTDDGIAIISCASIAAQGQCDAEQRIVQYDQFAGFLFKGEQVKAIAVDGGNRKWIGTNNGVWLISPDADKIINRFTQKNSPLPSNVIQQIAVDPVTGDVYIGTDQGLVSYRGTATEGGTTNAEVVTYPNPVPSGYGGTIAIRGLVGDADVRITDIGGQLIYRTRAQGGQATWNGLDYTGHHPQSGVCLIFITNKDGSQTHVGKLLFLH